MQPTKDIADPEQGQSMGLAFSRTAKRMVLFVAGFAVIAFAVGSETLLRIQANRSIAVRAELFATALGICDAGDFTEAAARLEARTDRLVVVATLGEAGEPREVVPGLPLHRDIAASALGSLGREFTVHLPGDKAPIEVVGAIVNPLGVGHAASSRVLLVMRFMSYRAAWLKALAATTLAVGAIAFLRLHTLNRWFDRQVAAPLREIAELSSFPDAALAQMPALQSGTWRETTQIARQIQSLLREFADADARARRVEQETRRQILHRELGFDLKLKRAKDEATFDPLTRARNRAFLEAELEPIFQQQRIRHAHLSAVMIDIDNFKRYNDTHGHQVGDTLLRFAGSLLRGGIRPTDHAIRYGGDEFLLLLTDTGASEARAIAERLVKLFGQYAGRLGKDCGVSMSAGVAAASDEECESGQMLVARADAALYSAKSGGKSTVVVDSKTVPQAGASGVSSSAASTTAPPTALELIPRTGTAQPLSP